MINSNRRKLALSGWLKNNGNAEYNSPLKLQKFLLLYEALSKVNGEQADFSNLKGYKRGPVFSTVWGDYTYDRNSFDRAADVEYAAGIEPINEPRAKCSWFVTHVLSERDLSSLTHTMNLWNSQKARILSGERQVPLAEADFNNDDVVIVSALESMYSTSLIDNSHVIEIDNNYFVFNKQDAGCITATHLDVLSELAEKAELHNPVYVEIDEEGMLIVD